jgi:hypothetical protein
LTILKKMLRKKGKQSNSIKRQNKNCNEDWEVRLNNFCKNAFEIGLKDFDKIIKLVIFISTHIIKYPYLDNT